jgi:hypothetical protein
LEPQIAFVDRGRRPDLRKNIRLCHHPAVGPDQGYEQIKCATSAGDGLIVMREHSGTGYDPEPAEPEFHGSSVLFRGRGVR